ncbi:mediator complex, subunit Med8 [Hypoxylon trugodes]|uniref:mediator complex, subunit Med8 n=1 Tax=Hypoxylon trugodes TaxID=326681 RepID=UPI00219722B3|nr:mediator complex, subunit Med8 [Hypoxylon trugodes]KAI1384310.1 mediator complex, subunit Med8 [Hypoxylon trugodes]
MASVGLSDAEFRTLDSTRHRLSQISSSLASLKADVVASRPLPSLDSLQRQSDVLQTNIQSLMEVSPNVAELFSHLVVHPSTNFPGRTQEMILLQLLRKKPEPDVATAMDEGRKMVAELPPTSDLLNGEGGVGKGPQDELENIWESRRNFFNTRIMDYVTTEAEDMFTEEERQLGIENVRTGLKRSLEEDEEDEDEDEEEGEGEDEDDDVMVIDRPPPPPAPGVKTQEVEGVVLENIMRFASRGEFVPTR